MYVLGLNAGPATFHDASACIVDQNGQVLSFIEEERISRVRHAPGAFPRAAVDRCLEIAGLAASDIGVVAVGWDVPRMSARWNEEWKFPSSGEFLDALGFGGVKRPDLQFVPHHRAHATSAFHASGFSEAAVLVVDGNGEDESISIFSAAVGSPMVRLRTWPRVYSPGYMYEAVSEWLGLGPLGSGKTMGLSAYGRDTVDPRYQWLRVVNDEIWSTLGNDPLLGYRKLMPMWRAAISAAVGQDAPTRRPADLARDSLAVQVAWSAQLQVENLIEWLVATARELSGIESVCIAGGVGLNCAANGRLSGDVFVPPVPHDTGVALGAAWTIVPPQSPVKDFSAYLGGYPGAPSADSIRDLVISDASADSVAKLLAEGAVGGICRGRSEIGPRALCHRSMLASPLDSDMAVRVNSMKDREVWRPFGPVTNVPAASHTPWWTMRSSLERYMVGASPLTENGVNVIPAVAHVDRTTRPQRLAATDEPFVDAVLNVLKSMGHPPVLLNTSLNGRGEPLVETADEALACARKCGLDFLVLNDDLVMV